MASLVIAARRAVAWRDLGVAVLGSAQHCSPKLKRLSKEGLFFLDRVLAAL